MPPDPRDVRVLTPRIRRALEGPGATAVLTDDEVKDLAADAIAEVILYTGGVFGKTLIVTSTEETYGSPAEYQTSEALTLAEQAVISSQAALNHFFHLYAGTKVAESISDEAQSWSYQLSSNLLTEQLKQLVKARDQALAIVAADASAALDSYVSFIAIRDAATSAMIEPWVDGALLGGGLEVDYRFG